LPRGKPRNKRPLASPRGKPRNKPPLASPRGKPPLRFAARQAAK